MLESELFGHEKGSFSGAVARKRGRFELANGGTIFLDEIGEINQNVQIKLLRVLQDKKFERVGGEETIEVDVHVVAATNKNLLEEIKKGNFREDLYYRLNVVHIEVPPLRERKEDIQEMTDFFLAKFNRKYAKHFILTDVERMKLSQYSWPGNVRELRNIIERYVVTGNKYIIYNLEAEDERNIVYCEKEVSPADLLMDEVVPIKEKMDKLELEYIRNVLIKNENNVQKAADLLGVHRSLIYRKLQNKKNK